MIRKLLVIAAAIAMPVSIVAVSGGMANASSPHTVGTDKVTCKDLTGTLTFSPKLDKAGYKSGSITTTVSASVSGCTVTGGTAETGVTGKVTGTLKGAAGTSTKPSGKCTGVSGVGTEIGTLKITWKATPAIGTSSLPVKNDLGGTNTKGYGTFTIPGTGTATGTGSFAGGSDKSVAQTVSKAGTFLASCEKSGTSSLPITEEAGVNAVALG